ncbi:MULTISPECIES: hypothetical protein [Pseudomonas]|jgi:hypothetical protein|uniref:hypothetical protein n=1 Tax=Pseudomonas TaxID=286 RepID=UPI000CD22AE9|nr:MULTISPECIES: hypothetical protein [unclassified Pseudomonas]MBB6155658.1 hypothetical protein [Pseudomonas sp. JAI115]POA24847.1 hypothetical protein C1895_13155 [Pseudomonas sp. FW305-3-2-15-E-TSA4]POA43057.1 hypothetical protein C1894_09200 [Pseudomonas sp. FW305-3-2-15-E-TSA2]
MAKPNYSFAKRQRDLEKEKKKEEKLQRKKQQAEEAALNPDGEVATDHDDDVDAPKDQAPDA